MDTLQALGYVIQIVIGVGVLVGGYFAVKQAKRDTLIKIQQETIQALNERFTAIEKKQQELEKENTSLRVVLTTIKNALLKRGIHITIDGDMVVLEDTRPTPRRKAKTAVINNGSN